MTMQYNYLRLFSLFFTIFGLHFCLNAQTTISLQAVKDNTLYESAEGALSNGSGDYIFAGKTGIGTIRRALIQFDLSSIPTNASIEKVSLEMNVSKSAGATTANKLYFVRTAWGEGTSDAAGPEGMGTAATDGDATWIHSFYPNQNWRNAGGDYIPIESATTTISGEGLVKWEDEFMAMDIQTWIEIPEDNFGWLIIGEESVETTANRFDSSESDNPPTLTIIYTLNDDDDDSDDDGNDDDGNDDDDSDDDGNDDDGNDDDDSDDDGNDDDGNDDDDSDDDGNDDDGNDDDGNDDDDSDDDGNDDDGNDDDDSDDDGNDDDDSDDDGNDDDGNDDDDSDDDGNDDDGNDDGNDDDDSDDDDNDPIADNIAIIQIIHNSSDPIVNNIDIDINGRAVAQNLAFRSATNFFEIPANQAITIGISPSNGFGGRSARAEQQLVFEGGKRYVLMASGVLRSNQFDRSVNGGDAIKANLFILKEARIKSEGGSGSVDLIAFHGATDAPMLDVVMPQIGQTPVDDLAYSNFTDYVSVPAFSGQVQLDVMTGDQNNMIGSFFGDLSLYKGKAITIFSSGFLNPRRNQNGANFGLFAALPDGTVFPLEGRMENRSRESVKLEQIVKLSPNPAESWVNIQLEGWKEAPLFIQLFDANGKLVKEEQVLINEATHYLKWNIINLPKMIYMLRCAQGDKVILQQLGVQ